jgi:hypothetical protein
LVLLKTLAEVAGAASVELTIQFGLQHIDVMHFYFTGQVCAATDVPERNSCLPKTRTSSRAFGSLTNSPIAPAAKTFVRFLNSTGNLP